MASTIVAQRYANSLIGLATEKNIVDEISKDMQLVQSVFSENREFLAVMSNPIIRHHKKLAILKGIFEKNVNPVTFSVMNLLTEKNREGMLLAIAEEYQSLLNDQQGVQKAQVVSASTLTDAQRAEITATVVKITGKKVVLEEKINEQLIGGYVLKIGDTQIDTSVKKHLMDLRVQLV